ncbi:glycosyltransferase family 2 protein [Hymenobacter terrenus]|uniref:glycosyltransferase family 2 protein n=1 Tax=Hymenobacter terrenus TaxID=1629124 RepID=UPI0009E4179E|nr:glycosyltransferase [Hymenobacter terrenus]
MAKLSVVMPVYNAERFLSEAIDSILAQSFTDFEFIILDDCSTDASVSIIKSYNDPRIRFYQNENNLGISETLNKGILLADSNLIARMDADDISHPQRLQRQYDYLTSHPECAMVSSLVRVVAEDGSVIREDRFDSRFYYYNLVFICWIYHPTVMYRKQAVLEVGLYTVPYSEDFELFWQLSRQFVISNIPAVLLDYRTTSQSLHQVTKKEEYSQAQLNQVLRNIRYYTGTDFLISANHLQCLQHDFYPLLAEQSTDSIVSCIEKLDFISKCILDKPNANCNKKDVREAYYYKRKFIILFYLRNLPRRKGIMLMIRLRCISLALKEVYNHRIVGRVRVIGQAVNP